MKRKSDKKEKRLIIAILYLGVIMVGMMLGLYVVQRSWAHRQKYHSEKDMVCTPLLGWFTREDRIAAEEDFSFTELEPGDILVTLSTHSLGWRHGHAALLLNEDTTLESTVWGAESCLGKVESWKRYSGFVVLRVKNAASGMGKQVANYAQKELCGIPYHLSAGFIGEKAPDADAPYFGVQCAYLVWYAWNRFGYDLDSDGGRLVTATDLLESDKLEVVQLYGMDPRKFLK